MAKRNLNTKTKTGAKNPTAAPKAAAQIAGAKNDSAQLLKKNRKAAAPVLLANGLNGSEASSSLQRKPEPVKPEVQGEAKPSTYIDRGLPLPENYGLDRLVALVRDPRWIYSYWELQGSIMPSVREKRGQSFIDSCAWVLRLHRIHENIAVDFEIDPSSGCWYLNVGGPGTYQLELGLLSPDGEWISLLASYVVKTPRTSPSDLIDEEWGVMPGEEETALLQSALGLADAAERGTSGFLGRLAPAKFLRARQQPHARLVRERPARRRFVGLQFPRRQSRERLRIRRLRLDDRAQRRARTDARPPASRRRPELERAAQPAREKRQDAAGAFHRETPAHAQRTHTADAHMAARRRSTQLARKPAQTESIEDRKVSNVICASGATDQRGCLRCSVRMARPIFK